MTAFDQAFQAAAAMGITVCVASGDNGSSDGVSDGADHVDFPASSPYALACGGTSLQAAGGIDRQRDGLERRRQWRRRRRRGQRLFCRCPPGRKGSRSPGPAGRRSALAHAGRARCVRRRRPGNRLPGAGRRHRHGDRRHQRGGAALGRADRADQCGQSQSGRLHQPASLCQPAPPCATSPKATTAAFAAGPGWDACTGLGSPNGQQVGPGV